MESYINELALESSKGGYLMGKKVLIATVYNPDPVLLAATRLGAERIFLLVDKDPSKEQNDAISLVQNSLGRVTEIKLIKVEVYNIVAVAEKCVSLIDALSKDDSIYVNITSGRKTQAIGLLFAAYARSNVVKKIAYNPEDDKSSIVYLPKMSFKLTESQKQILDALEKSSFDNMNDLAKKVDLSTAMLYRAIDELKSMDLVSTDDGIKVTDAGRIARL